MLAYLVIFLLIICAIYYLLTNKHDYWKKRGVPATIPKIYVGNMGPAVVLKKSMAEIFDEMYKEFQDYAYNGFFNMQLPAILLHDTDVIHNVLSRDFHSFQNNWPQVDDPILSKSPFFAKEEKWKSIRTQISPQFAAGKVKLMFPLIQKVCKDLLEHVKNHPDSLSDTGLDAKDLASKFIADCVASCGFGVEGRSFIGGHSEIRELCKQIKEPSRLMFLKELFALIFPFLGGLLKQRYLSGATGKKFKTMLAESVKSREDSRVTRNDFLESIKELKPMTSFEYTPDYMAAHALTFFINGFEPSSLLLSFLMYEMAVNPHFQAKFREEIDDVVAKHGGKLTFEAVQNMSYLDKIVLEGLRKYPPFVAIARICTSAYKLPFPKGSGPDVTLERGTAVFIPVLSIHHDSLYYPKPHRFEPDRFNEETKNTRPKHCFLGFGDGPRVCLGQLFGTVQVKAALITIVSNFEIRLNPKTKSTVKLDTKRCMTAAKETLWLNFFPRVPTSSN